MLGHWAHAAARHHEVTARGDVAPPPVPHMLIASGGAVIAVIRARMARTTRSVRHRLAAHPHRHQQGAICAASPRHEIERALGIGVGQPLACGEAGEEA